MNKAIITVGLLFALGLSISSCGNGSKAEAPAAVENITVAAGDNTVPYPQQNPADEVVENPTSLTWNKMEHDFGKVKKDSQNNYEFTFKNTGSNPLIINSAKGSCGCTVPEYPKEPVMPGEEGKILVTYTAGSTAGETEKLVTIDANTEPRTTTLKIKANVQ